MSQDANTILSVGCGTGAFDERILGYARARMNQVTYLGIEPNEISAAEFLQAMGSQICDQVDVSVLVQRFGEQTFENEFDLILFVQSMSHTLGIMLEVTSSVAIIKSLNMKLIIINIKNYIYI